MSVLKTQVFIPQTAELGLALQGALRATMEAHFFKNMAIMGGLLFLATFGAGPYSIDAARSSKA